MKIGVISLGACDTWQHLVVTGTIKDGLQVVGFTQFLPTLDDTMYFIVINKSAMYPHRQRRTGRQVKHVPMSQ